jgi:hypothetical protein
MTYEYRDLKTGRVREVEQKINDRPFTHYSPNQRSWLTISDVAARHFIEDLHPVQRLVSGGTGFHLHGKSWAKDGYQ